MDELKRTPMRNLIAAAGLCAMAACATKSEPRTPVGDSAFSMVIPAGAARHEMRDDELFLMPATLGPQPMPEYPAAYLGDGLPPPVVCVDVVVEPEGASTRVSRHTGSPACPDGADARTLAFVQSVLGPVGAWRYFGAQVCSFPAGVEHNDECSGEGVEIRPVAVRLTYVFRFFEGRETAVLERQDGG